MRILASQSSSYRHPSSLRPLRCESLQLSSAACVYPDARSSGEEIDCAPGLFSPAASIPRLVCVCCSSRGTGAWCSPSTEPRVLSLGFGRECLALESGACVLGRLVSRSCVGHGSGRWIWRDHLLPSELGWVFEVWLSTDPPGCKVMGCSDSCLDVWGVVSLLSLSKGVDRNATSKAKLR